MFILKNRTIIYISGTEQKSFLQGLISNDINKVNENTAIYTTMLTPQGRFLYDFFIIQFKDKILLDCSNQKCAEIIKKLSLYKLRADVEIGKMAEYEVGAIINQNDDQKIIANINKEKLICFADPRSKNIGLRIIGSKDQLSKLSENSLENIDSYNYQRLNLKITDDSDLTYDKSLILEYGFDNLNAIDYQKGCYVGQEVTARTHYRGTLRKAIFLIEIANLSQIKKSTEITCDNKKTGIILSSVFYNKKLYALALIKNIDNNNQKIDLANSNLQADGNSVFILK